MAITFEVNVAAEEDDLKALKPIVAIVASIIVILQFLCCRRKGRLWWFSSKLITVYTKA